MRMNEIVGDWLQGYRANHGLTLDQIADASHRYGTNWGNVNVSRMEKGGSKADALPTLMILLATLNDLTGDELTMADVFIDYAGTVDIGDYATSYENVVSALQGDNVSFRHTHADTLKQLLEEDERDRERLLEEHPEWAEYLAEERERDGDGMRFSKHVVSATRPPHVRYVGRPHGNTDRREPSAHGGGGAHGTQDVNRRRVRPTDRGLPDTRL